MDGIIYAPDPDDSILSAPALEFIALLERRFRDRRADLLRARIERQAQLTAGARPDFLPATASVRSSEWTITPPPKDLEDRRVELTAVVRRDELIRALGSGAQGVMADFEDALSPTWRNVIDGHANIRDAVFGRLDGTQAAIPITIRPRGWHLNEKHLLVDDKPVSASIFDFGMHFFHCARETLDRGTGPYYCLPKVENHLEARLWNDIFFFAQSELGIDRGSIQATVLIENVLAAYQMDEIIYELREHCAGLCGGRWDYIFSIVKKFSHDPDMVLPDRNSITWDVPFLQSFNQLLIDTCHRRGTHAIGGMTPLSPDALGDDDRRARFDAVRVDKQREVDSGYDGTWVTHPDLVPVAREVFDSVLGERPNQIERRADMRPGATDLLAIAATPGVITEAGVRLNIEVGVRYLASWLSGRGAMVLHHAREDSATAEISRAQLWQWIRTGQRTDEGVEITADYIRSHLDDLLATIAAEIDETAYAFGHYDQARFVFEQVVLADKFIDFLTVPAYDLLD